MFDLIWSDLHLEGLQLLWSRPFGHVARLGNPSKEKKRGLLFFFFFSHVALSSLEDISLYYIQIYVRN